MDKNAIIEDNVLEAGLGFAVKRDKDSGKFGDFHGRKAVMDTRERGLSRRGALRCCLGLGCFAVAPAPAVCAVFPRSAPPLFLLAAMSPA